MKKLGEILGLAKNSDQYQDVPDDLKWAIPLHEHLTSLQGQEYFKVRKILSEQRVERELDSRKKRL